MSGFSYPQPTFISPIYNPAFYLSLNASGYLTYDYAQTLYLGKNDYRLTYITGISPGTATPGVALVVGNDGGLSGLGALSCSSLTVNGSSIVSAPAYVQSIIPGTAANSKALVLDSSGAIGTIASLAATNITGTLQTAAQTNITSIGSLTGLTIGGNATLSGASRVLSLTGAGSYIDATAFRQEGVTYDISLISRLVLTTLGTCEASKAIVLDATRSCSNINGMTFNPSGTGLNIPALSFDGTVFNQNYYISVTEGSAGISKALITNATRDISGLRNLGCTGTFTATTSIANPLTTTDQLVAGSGGTFNLNPTTWQLRGTTINATAAELNILSGVTSSSSELNYVDIVLPGSGQASKGLVLDALGEIDSIVSLSATSLVSSTLSTSGNITCGGLVNGFVGYGNQSNITTVGKLTELAIGAANISNEYLRITGNGLDYLDGTYTRMVRCVGSNATPVEFQIEVHNGSNSTSANSSWIGNRTNNDLRFGVNDGTAMILTAAGRLGVGTTSPNVPLHIPGTTSISYGNGSTMVYRLRTNNGVTEMALGPLLYDTTAIFGGYISCAALAATSDRRLKRNIQSAPLDRIKRLYDDIDVVLYEWIPSEKRQGQEVGLIAQDLVKAGLTDLVSVFHRDGMPEGEDPHISPKDVQLNVDYSRIAAYNMRMIQHLLAEIEELKGERTS